MLRLTATKENLSKGLSIVAHVASKNLTLPILQNIRLEAKNGQTELAATNLEIGVRFRVRGKIDEEGDITLPARVFQEVVGSFSGERVEATLEEQTMVLVCEQARATIRGVDAQEFPVIPAITTGERCSVRSETLTEALSQTLFSVAADDTRPEIHGVFIDAHESAMTIAATDSFRLSEKKIQLSIPTEKGFTCIVPLRTFQEVQRILSTMPPSDVQLIYGENQLLVCFDDGELISRLVEGKYPDYQQVITTNWNTKAVVKSRDFAQLVRGASLFCRSGINDIHLIFSPEQKEVRVTAANSQVGEFNSHIAAEVDGEENDLVLNYRFLLDGIAAAESETVALELVNNASPCVLRPNVPSPTYTHIIMPIKQ